MLKPDSKNKKIVVCAMSGGVDSSVSVYLLKEAGDFDVRGVFLKLFSGSKEKEAENRARKVALSLEIPFQVIDLRKEFKKKIIDYFLKENKKGLTPNPCVFCNQQIKFGLLWDKARKMGADFLATGHYARIKADNDGFQLMRARDKNKDQSYFLWRLNQKQLQYILFPVGGYQKEKVKDLAREMKIDFSKVPESQEICFIKKSAAEFLRKELHTKKGIIINKEQEKIGQHQGLWFYTIGQRKGIKLPQGPFYVLEKDIRRNYLIVTKKKKDLLKKEIIINNVNWISDREPKTPLNAKVKIRYGHRAAAAQILKSKRNYKLKFNKAQLSLTPGQSAVFYQGDKVLGGGIIL